MAKLTECPHCGESLEGMADGRAKWWLYRVRLFDTHMPAIKGARDPIADSADGHPPDAPGVDKGRGVRSILSIVAQQAIEWHGGQVLRGMDSTTLDTKERGTRSSIGRHPQWARVFVEYDTRESFSESPDHKPRYLARVDLVRIKAPTNGDTDEQQPEQ